MNRIKKNLQWKHSFHYTSKHVSKRIKESLKRLHEVNQNQEIIKTSIKKEEIEHTIFSHNLNHFKKNHNTIAYKDKIYSKLQDDKVKDKILNGQLRKEDYDHEDIYNFLKLMKHSR